MKSFRADILGRLVELPGLPGREEQVAEFIRASMPANVKDISQDALGNLIVHIPGKGKRVMVVAHMDEVGLIVQRILPNGFLKVERIGGFSIRALPGSRLSLWTSRGQVPAIAGILPKHLDSDEPINDFSKIFVDIGAKTAAQARELGVAPGDGLTWDSPLHPVGDNRISGKALDDRLGCYVMIRLAEMIKPKDLDCDLYLVFSVQEETILMGGNPVVNMVSPDILIGLDVAFSFDTPDLEGKQCDLALGKGPAIKWMDAIRGKLAAFVPDRKLSLHIRDIAEKNDIPLQDEIVVGMSTAVTPMMFAGKGARTAAISIPIRYHHTPNEIADIQDIENTMLLVKKVIENVG